MKKCLSVILIAAISVLLSQTVKKEKFTKNYFIDEKGDHVTVMSYAGFPPKELPLPDVELPDKVRKDGEKGFFALNNVPAYTWCYGCMATSAAIMAAYYDNFGAPTVYSGPMNGGVAPQTNSDWNSQASQNDTDQCPLAASKNGLDGRGTKGHGDDYWTGYLDEATDPYYGHWTQHDFNSGQRAAADFMGTNQWYNWENDDGWTTIWSSVSGVYDYTGSEGSTPALRDGVHGLRLFYESMGLTVDKNYTRRITGYDDPDDNPDMGPATGGYEFSMYKASIDAGRPVFIQVEGHSIIGFGYDDSYTPPRIYVRDTWDNLTSPTAHYIVWGGEYANMQMYGVSEIVLGTECYYAAPENVFALNNNRSVTVSWDDPSKGTKSMTYIVYRDGTQIASGVNATSYIDNGASDGLHYYSLKAYYVTNSFTSYMSVTASVYVSASVTSFSDDFERTVITDKWLFDPTIGSWGRDTVLKYAGLASLADSPNANYADNTDQLAAGGSIAEVAPGLNFSAAADANCSFYLRYLIEESFDYLHFQACKDGLTWETLKTWSSEAITTWNLETISLGLFAGESNVRLRFILVTDPGYNAAGSNIDNFEITTSTFDPIPPYIYYTKGKDYYTEKSDGFEIVTQIIDFTGVNYARVYYKVNGGTEIYVNPSSVIGSTYSWKLPVQTPGSLVEFRIEAQDTNSPPATGSKGPFYYREGLHQKYDSGVVSYYTEVVTTTAQYDTKAVANKFTSFHEDIAGAIIRGYDDASQLEDNANMMIHVWADDNGLPGANMIVPFSVPNPATLSDTNAWLYVDLSSYSALDQMVGDYYIGFECGTIPNTTVTRSCQTAPTEEGTFDYKRSYSQYYTLNGSGLIWEQSTGYNFHIRCVTTDYGIAPGIIDPSPSAIAETVAASSTTSRTLNVNNIGGYPLDYTASIEYNGYASSGVVHENNFETVLGWTSTGTRAWSRQIIYDGGTLNGTPMAAVSASTNEINHHSYLTSPIINMSAFGEGSTISFQQYKSSQRSTGGVEVSTDGTNWFSIYSNTAIIGAMGAPDVQTIAIPPAYLTATTRFRFHATLPSSSGYWAIDNIVITGAVPYTWMTLDGGTTSSGTVAVAGSDPITVGFNSADLEAGQYTANILLNSQYSNESVPVTLNVLPEPGFPGVETVEITDINFTSAKIKGNITTLGDPLPTSYGICWNTTGNPTTSDSIVNEGNATLTGEFISDLENLTKDTKYYVRAYITNIVGTDYGDELFFSTKLFNGAGTIEDPYQISSLSDLYDLSVKSLFWGRNYIQTTDINASETVNWDSGLGFLPIGNSTIPFYGVYDGQSHIIDSLFINRASIAVGLFGNTNSADIKNLSVINADVTGTSYTGIICGYASYYSTIEECNSHGVVSGGISSGGLVGYLYSQTDIVNSFSNTSVTGTGYLGGLVGQNNSSYISSSYSKGDVTGTSNSIGGLVGYNYGTIDESYSTANVSGISNVGGLVGYNYFGRPTNCYSSGYVSGTSEVGGCVGKTYYTTATNCFWDIETSGQTISAGGVGKTTAEMKTLSTFTDATWDFAGETVNGTDDLWNFNAYYNDGYPYLSWQVFPLANPQNVKTSIVGGNVLIDWDDMPDEIGYNVYSSDDPYGEFTLLTTVAVSEYTYTPAESKKFFYITGKDVLKKDQPHSIVVPEKKEK